MVTLSEPEKWQVEWTLRSAIFTFLASYLIAISFLACTGLAILFSTGSVQSIGPSLRSLASGSLGYRALAYLAQGGPLLLLSSYFLYRAQRTKGLKEFSLLLDAGLFRTLAVGATIGIASVYVLPVLERICLLFIEMPYVVFLGGRPLSLVEWISSQSVLEFSRRSYWMPQSLWFTATVVLLLWPIAEEVFYRGFLYPAMRSKWTSGKAALLNAALFSATHGSLYGFIGYLLSGLVLCWSFERTRALLVPIIVHIMLNVPPFLDLFR